MYQEAWPATFCKLLSEQKRQRRRLSLYRFQRNALFFFFFFFFFEVKNMFTLTIYLQKSFLHDRDFPFTGSTRGVMVSTSAFLACHQCYSAGSSLVWGLNFRALVCCIFWSSVSGVFTGYSGFLPSFIGYWFQPIKQS